MICISKYDYDDRFNDIDPLWEKYTGWTGYQYSLKNPVNASDGNGKFIVPEKYKDLYPNFYNLLKNEIPKYADNENVVNAISKASGASKNIVKKILKDGEGSNISVENLSRVYAMTIDAKSTIIRKGFIYDIENYKSYTKEIRNLFYIITILHEATQVAYFTKPNRDPVGKNRGEMFEEILFDKVIQGYDDVKEKENEIEEVLKTK